MSKLNRRQFSKALAASGGIGMLGTGADARPQNERGGEPSRGWITDVEGVRVGHYTDTRRPTGCTAVLSTTRCAQGSTTMAPRQVNSRPSCSNP
jgi:hypothetical protein